MKPQSLPMVYLVDDEEVVRDALAWLLRSRRLLSEGFGSAEAFESMLDGLPRSGRDWPSAPSCLLLDVRMPGMSGLALFERLIERGLLATLPVIFLTGHGRGRAVQPPARRQCRPWVILLTRPAQLPVHPPLPVPVPVPPARASAATHVRWASST